MLPGMAKKPSVTIVGAGNLATALSISLRSAGYTIEAIVARERGGALSRAKRLAQRVGACAVLDLETSKSGIIWLCVPDTQIRRVAGLLSAKLDGEGKVALHSSGALASDELQPFQRKGAAVASVHPLMTFVKNSAPSFHGVPFAIEGDPRAVNGARAIVRDLRGQSFHIRTEEKNAYHAWGTFASPLLTAFLITTEQVAELAGVKSKSAKRRMLPILSKTLANYGNLGAAKGFSGPIIRGDLDTVRRHLDVLRRSPVARQVYVALAGAALEYLPSKNKASLKRLLQSSREWAASST